MYICPRNQRNNEFHILGIKFTSPLLHHHLGRLLFACFTHNILGLALRVGGQRHWIMMGLSIHTPTPAIPRLLAYMASWVHDLYIFTHRKIQYQRSDLIKGNIFLCWRKNGGWGSRVLLARPSSTFESFQGPQYNSVGLLFIVVSSSSSLF